MSWMQFAQAGAQHGVQQNMDKGTGWALIDPTLGTGVSIYHDIGDLSGKNKGSDPTYMAYERAAQEAENKAKYEEQKSAERVKAIMGRQRVLYAKAGVDITSGSPLLILAETAAQGEKEALMIQRSGRNEAALDRYYGDMAYRQKLIQSFLGPLSFLGSLKFPDNKGGPGPANKNQGPGPSGNSYGLGDAWEPYY